MISISTSSFQDIKELSKVFGFDFNDPYLTPQKIKYKIGKLDRKSAKKLADTVIDLRKLTSQTIPLEDQKGRNFWFNETTEIKEYLHLIDVDFSDQLLVFMGEDVESAQKSLTFDSLIEEAYFSSRIEGAVTTRRRAKEIIVKSITPTNKAEKMFKNNYLAMELIQKQDQEELDIDIILELHKIITQDTLEPDDQDYSGKFRDNDDISIMNISTGETIYNPPSHTKISKLMNDLISWTNNDKPFIHPVLKASIIHFYLSYIHPFVDGNGRMARTLFYYQLYKSDYEIMKFLSISSTINDYKNLYYRVFKEVENNESDLTYFLIFSLKTVYESFEKLRNAIYDKLEWISVQTKIRKENLPINKKQLKLMKGFCFKRYDELSVAKVTKINNVVYETARKHLNQLVKWNLLAKTKKGKIYFYFLPKT